MSDHLYLLLVVKSLKLLYFCKWYFYTSPWTFHVFLFSLDFIYLFLERGEQREKEREGNINVWLPLTCPVLGTWPTTQACVLTGN